ncbi:swi5-dependent recombination DNA repair protein 1 homolog [Arachis ipaensis]|uniref:swi5-dependent recombination DNA repair protein 1 homolog n=1 Tax=Arachis ipaensis TaxID=130454 RepID=UPI000A2B4893|nr:swi5-dependent recombination DNA repair protein 1 homolog [Arachis ipaensis]XP_025664470.1 swi5-dependent recombination DNA repair protein 1 homolog [Arachis hypogaea]
MRKKTIAKRPPREKVYKLPTKPSTRSQDRTFTPSPSPPTSPPRCDPMARTKNTPRYPASAKPTPPPKTTPFKPGSSKPGSSKPSSSKGKCPAAEEPVPEPTQPKSKSVPVHSQRGTVHSYVKGRDIVLNNETISDSLKYTDVGPCAYTSVKWDEGVGIFYNDALANICEHQKGPTRSERVVLDDKDDDFVLEDSPAPSTEGTSISTGKKSILLNVVKDVVQEFVSQSNHLIAMSKEQRKLASNHENFLKKSRDRVTVFISFIDNLQEDEDPATDVEEEANSEENGSDA